MKKKVLIGYADYGAGHRSVAQYVKNYFEDKGEFEVKVINFSMFSNGLGKFGFKLFDYANKNEFLFSFFYGIFNNKMASKGNQKIALKSFDTPELRKVMCDFNPDIVISTHFFVSYLTSFYNKEGVIKSKLLTIMTDFAHHGWWTVNHNETDYYIVANDIVKNELINHGVNSKKIFPYGSPINKDGIVGIEDKSLTFKKYSLSGERPVYLFFAGGSDGYNYVFDYFKTLVKKNFPIDIVFVSGKNKKLKSKCEDYVLRNNIKNVIVLGFTKDVFNLLNISDVVITKPGGTTLNECIEMKKPVILIPGVGGQENYNARFMCKSHYAIKARGALSLARKVKLCLNYPFIINSMRNKLSKLDERNSCKKIYDLVVKILKN